MATYQPRPVDNSKIELSDDLPALTEQLAENAHDHWAKRRIAEGWELGRGARRRREAASLPRAVRPAAVGGGGGGRGRPCGRSWRSAIGSSAAEVGPAGRRPAPHRRALRRRRRRLQACQSAPGRLISCHLSRGSRGWPSQVGLVFRCPKERMRPAAANRSVERPHGDAQALPCASCSRRACISAIRRGAGTRAWGRICSVCAMACTSST